MPFALSFLLLNSLHNDLKTPFGGYHVFWQCIGFSFPILGILIFVLAFFLLITPEPFEPQVEWEFDPNDNVGTGARSSSDAYLQEDEALSKGATPPIKGEDELVVVIKVRQ